MAKPKLYEAREYKTGTPLSHMQPGGYQRRWDPKEQTYIWYFWPPGAEHMKMVEDGLVPTSDGVVVNLRLGGWLLEKNIWRKLPA